MMIEAILQHLHPWRNAARQQSMADAYRPIVRGVLLPGTAYYIFVTWGHWRDETGANLLALGGLSLVTAILYFLIRHFFLTKRQTTLRRLEIAGLATNALMYTNVVAYLAVHFEEEKLIYFVLMAVVFSTSGVTLRATLASVSLSIGTLFWLASHASPERFNQFAFIGVATSFAAFGMATLLRQAILRQIDARLVADGLASLDSLTGIANRRAVFKEIDELTATKTPFWVGIMDLDGFKAINDIYGHSVGDTLLRQVVDRLQRFTSDEFRLGRIGGDEFAILVRANALGNEIEDLGNRLIAEVRRPFEVSGLQLTVGATTGFAKSPDMGDTSRLIYEKADFALYRGKQYSRGRTIIFNANEDLEMKEAIALEKGLREADLEKELHLMFQPQHDVGRNRVVSFEALARWESPTLGSVRPDKFIRAAERSGQIQKVTAVLFRKALDALDQWPEEVGISFNLSAQDVSDRVFVFSLVAEVTRRQICPGRVEFEITETAVMKDISASRALLEDLSSLRFRIALDDFGSGYSSFEYIDQLPLNKVKIDKSFIRKVANSPTSREIVAGVITLCRNLDLRCVLEGVETEAEMAILTSLRPEIIQGYLFGRPMSLAAATDRVAAELDAARRAS